MAITGRWNTDYMTKDLESGISDTEKAYSEAEKTVSSLPALISKVYDALKSAGRERDAYALSDAADRFSRTAGGLGVNAFARSQALFDLQSRLGSAANLREADLSERELNQLRNAQQAIAQMGVDKAQQLFSQKSRLFQSKLQANAETRTSVAAANAQRLAASRQASEREKDMFAPSPGSLEADARQRAMAERSPISAAYTGSQPNTESQISALADDLVRKNQGGGLGFSYGRDLTISGSPANAYTMAKNIVLNKGLGGSWGAGVTPQAPTVTPMGQQQIGQQAAQPARFPTKEEMAATGNLQTVYPPSRGVAPTSPGSGTGTMTMGGKTETVGGGFNPANYGKKTSGPSLPGTMPTLDSIVPVSLPANVPGSSWGPRVENTNRLVGPATQARLDETTSRLKGKENLLGFSQNRFGDAYRSSDPELGQEWTNLAADARNVRKTIYPWLVK